MLKTVLILLNKWKKSFEKNSTKSSNSAENKVSNALKRKAQAEKYATEIANFQRQSIEIVTSHLSVTEYAKHRVLMKEINFLLHYTFCVLEDDFYRGSKILKNNITKIDDYVFSQYRSSAHLEHNIKKLATLAFSNRFDEDPKENLLAYFVFIEETGFELIMLLEDFYNMLLKTEKKSKFDIGMKKTFSLDKNYAKEHQKAEHEYGKYETLMTQDMTHMVTPDKAKRKIMEDVLKNEKYELKK